MKDTLSGIPHVSDTLNEMLDVLRERRDIEVSELAFVLPQYIRDHNDRAAWRNVDRQVNALACAFDRMIALLERTAEKASAIESSAENFYGD